MKKMTGKTTAITVILAVTLIFSMILTGCAEEKKPVEIDINSAADTLFNKVKFDDRLAKIEAEAVKYLYGTDDTVTGVVYIGSGATAEEIAVFDAGTEEAGETLLATVKKHVADQIESYRNYVPAEVARLEKAVVVREGRYVLLCVTDDVSAAKSTIDEILKG